jgi:cell division protein FtsB
MNVDLGIWSKLNRLVVFLLYLAGLIAVALWYLPLIQHNERLRKEILRLETQIQTRETTNHQLKNAFEALRGDTKTLERLARERLGYAKPGETVIRFETPSTNGYLH